VNKSQHYPDKAFVQFTGIIDRKFKETIEAKLNEIVSQALPIKASWWDKDDLIEKGADVGAHTAISGGELARIVEMEGAGGTPCCGTHVSNSSLVGKVVVNKISYSKGNTTIAYSISD
jgi:Ser-tRNA(Ala) deacylase AlaX